MAGFEVTLYGRIWVTPEDLSAAPEAEMGWGVRTSPAFRFADVSLISAQKR
jgi:hypothetical protein